MRRYQKQLRSWCAAEATNERNSFIKATWIWDVRFLTNWEARCWSRKTSVMGGDGVMQQTLPRWWIHLLEQSVQNASACDIHNSTMICWPCNGYVKAETFEGVAESYEMASSQKDLSGCSLFISGFIYKDHKSWIGWIYYKFRFWNKFPVHFWCFEIVRGLHWKFNFFSSFLLIEKVPKPLTVIGKATAIEIYVFVRKYNFTRLISTKASQLANKLLVPRSPWCLVRFHTSS